MGWHVPIQTLLKGGGAKKEYQKFGATSHCTYGQENLRSVKKRKGKGKRRDWESRGK